MFGKLDKPENEVLADLNFREIMTLAPLVVFSFWIGLYPKPFFDVLNEPVDRIVRQVDKTYVFPDSVARFRPVEIDDETLEPRSTMIARDDSPEETASGAR